MISIVLPVYRVEKYIRACIQSVLGQTYRDFEVILVDDGSPDQSAAIAEELLRLDGTIPYYIIHTENRGVSAARNTGLANANGEYVVMVDSDDVLSPQFLQEYVDMMQCNPDLDIYSCGFNVVDENNWQDFNLTAEETVELKWDEAQLAFFDRRIRFLLPTLMLSCDFMRKHSISFDENVRYSEDVQFIWRCLAHNRKHIMHCEKQLYNYILHPGSTMTASGIKKILTCCSGIEQVHNDMKEMLCEPVQSQMLMRTYFSMLHGASKMMKFSTFCELYEQSGSKKHIRAQTRSGSAKIRIIALTLLWFRPLGYWIMRKF